VGLPATGPGQVPVVTPAEPIAGRTFSCAGICILALLVSALVSACANRPAPEQQTITITDQLGRRVEVPRHVERFTALHHFGGQIVYALKQQHRLVEQALYGIEASALEKVDKQFAALPRTMDSHSMNIESMVALRPQVAFVYASFEKSDMTQIENAGIKVVAVRGETLEQGYEAVRLMARILDCEKEGQAYLDDCQRLVALVQERLKDIPLDQRRRVLFSGPKSIYTVATGEMLQSQILSLAGATNLATGLKGFWADISPEQMARWNPDVIFVGSSLATYGITDIYDNSQFKTVKAIKEHQVHVFPSTIGWWDYPAPHCVLGVVWTAKTLYPDRFKDIDVRVIADDFYAKYLGHTFTEMGGSL
jgi:iron complex transport system substrate-binding protein